MKPILFALLLLSIILSCALIDERQRHQADMEKALDLADTVADRCRIAEDTLTLMFGQEWSPGRLMMEDVTVTAYQSKREQTDSTPYLNASGGSPMTGQIAVSRDLGLEFGQVVHLVDIGSFVVSDVMAAGKRKSIDIWTGDGHAARLHCRREATAIWLR